ncbi:MAG: phosphoribosylformylglycinamidine synthase subunit PurS [Henriciella sp.]|nr:phosphoribosylformylglycinamidine synthase [Hyphomonadaceae bacterium]OUX93829.1 MAG: phosphoribosylformylglycinamidine synthase [Hyphomonas sp. TMED17]CAI8301295.1 MAG: Phosphoribosylformylglycinamidine synthase subunit PurS [Hyphomonas sp. TMED17]
MKAVVHVGLKQGVLDPQGKAISDTLLRMGFDEVNGARIGKVIELDLEDIPADRAADRIKDMCEKLLANTVIEVYRYELLD